MSWAARAGGPTTETSPEELIAAAHAGCFSMAMATLLAEADHAPEELSVSADCRFDPDALRITTIELEVAARAPGLDPAAFADITHRAEALCPVSNALRGNVEILVRARLEAGAGG